MQNMDIISVNLWQILISLVNLFLLFLIIKKFLFGPVKKVLDQRQSQLDEQYAAAENAEIQADKKRKAWEDKLSGANAEADAILQKAQADIAQEKKKALNDAKDEISGIAMAIAEKVVCRELNAEDQADLVDSFIAKLGDEV